MHTLGRRDLPAGHPKLTQHRVDFAALPALPPVDEVYLALGTTIKVAGSRRRSAPSTTKPTWPSPVPHVQRAPRGSGW